MGIEHNVRDFWKNIDNLVKESKIVIDRRKGSAHPRFPDFIYPLDYGYLEDTNSMDNNGIDVWIGSRGDRSIETIIVTVDLLKRDSEIKILIGCTNEEKELIRHLHNNNPYTKGLLIHRQLTEVNL